jgi:glutamate-1-semialdehyde 2,1-aminomutase
MKPSASKALFDAPQRCSPGGELAVRAFKAVGGTPVFCARARAYVWDADGNRYLGLTWALGPLLLGHADPDVLEAIARRPLDGTTLRGLDRAGDRARRGAAGGVPSLGADAPGVLGHRGDRCRRCAWPRGFTGRSKI